MIDFSAAADAVRLLGSDPWAWIVVPPGILIGLVFGAVPGLSTSIAMAVFLPFTLYMDFLPAVLFLSAIFTGGGFGGAIPAILLNIPGTSAAVATAFDGYPMARQGRHSLALGVGLAASTLGATIGYLVLFAFVDPLADWVLRLGPTEMLIVALWGLTLIAALSSGAFAKGLVAGILGLLLATVGYSDAGQMRGTFGSMYLLDGIPVIPALLGLFAASELVNLIGTDYIVANRENRRLSAREILQGIGMALRHPVEIVRGALIGTGIGAIPGVGSSVSNLLAYSLAKKHARDPQSFGKGNPVGVLASESANSSSEGGSMATLLALGLPGGAGTAILLGAFAMHDITGGPRFISEQKDVVYAIILGNFAQALLLIVMGIGFVFLASSLVKIPLRYLSPSVMVFSVFGAYALTGNMVGPITVVGFGILGWLLRRYGYPVAATVVGLLLGDMAEGEFVRSYQISGGNLAYLADRPITLVLLVLLALSILYPILRSLAPRFLRGGAGQKDPVS